MATKVANGSSLSPPQRPPFRKQPSSVSGAHPMTVALATPPAKVDYSVTKGGARTWAVLLVFMFLCSSLYTVFSAKEIAELAVDLDGDGHVDLDDDVADNIDEVAEHQRRTARETTPSSTKHDRVHAEVHSHHHHGGEDSLATSDDDEDDEPEELESQLFAGLRKKIEKNMKKVKDMITKEVEEHKEEEDEEESEEKEERAPVRQRRRKGKREEKKRKIVEEGEEDDESDEVEEEPKKDTDDEVEEGEEEEEKKEEKEEESEEEEEEEEKEKAAEDEDVPQRQRKGKKKHTVRHITADAPERECRRKHCPQPNTAEPRKGLLKKKRAEILKKQQQRRRFEEYEDDEDEEENGGDSEEQEENEKDGENENDDSSFAPVQEVIALKKYRSSGREAYKRHAITNRDDHRHREQLDQADFLVEKHNYDEALVLFDSVLRVNPDSPRSHFGKARAYDIRSEYSASEKDADLAIKEYELVLENDETPDALYRQAASRLIEKARFRGQMHRCLRAQRALIDRFPDEVKLQTDIGLTFLMMKRYDDARRVFKDIIDVHPNNAVALAYYGFILKVCDNDLEGGVTYMRRGLRLGGDSIIDAKFYYHLGHGLMVLGRTAEAYSVYEKGADLGLFLSAQQRSMYNMEGLTGRPWWTLEQTGYGKHLKGLERNWVSIRHEAMRAMNDVPDRWTDGNKAITVDGDWKIFTLMDDGLFSEENCEITPQTCAMLREFRAQSHNATKSDMFLSVLTSGTQVLPHCGPSNTRLQAHLGLVVPSEARIRVASDQRGWKTGRFIVFDDSFEHSMHFDGASSSAFRLVLTIDLWHPEVDPRLRHDPED